MSQQKFSCFLTPSGWPLSLKLTGTYMSHRNTTGEASFVVRIKIYISSRYQYCKDSKLPKRMFVKFGTSMYSDKDDQVPDDLCLISDFDQMMV